MNIFSLLILANFPSLSNGFWLLSSLLTKSPDAMIPDLGAPNYKCGSGLMSRSKVRPTNVNALRPADISVVMALGDSLTVIFLYS